MKLLHTISSKLFSLTGKSFVYIVILCSFTSSFGCKSIASPQTDTASFVLQFQIPIKVKLLTTDKLQQAYIVTEDNELIKYTPEGKVQFKFNNNTLGRLAHVDVTNPFNILCYYADYRTIISLDRTLSQTGEYNLYDLDVNEVKTIASSNDNNIWLFDDLRFKLKKIDRQGKVLLESDDLSLLLHKSFLPNFILERDNWVYVNDPAIGILVFDTFGQYVKTLPILDLTSFQVLEDQLVYVVDGKIHTFHLKALSKSTFPLPEGKAVYERLTRIQKNRLYLADEEHLSVYRF